MIARIAAFGLGVVLVTSAPAVLAAPKASEVPPLVKKLKTAKDPKERAEAAQEIGRIGQVKWTFTKDAVPDLVEALGDKDAGVRREVALTLGEIKADPKLAVAPLGKLLKDPDNGVKAAAAESLGYFGPKAKEVLPALTELQTELNKLSQDDKNKNGQLIQAVNGAIQAINQK